MRAVVAAAVPPRGHEHQSRFASWLDDQAVDLVCCVLVTDSAVRNRLKSRAPRAIR
jgi:hypothetical protein